MYKVGQVIQGTITGIKPYGAFVKVDEKTSGLIHISEISEYYI
ncbi:MAG: S1 RNA-binding domain-containing protein, partial [Erysipelotrichia bacterium]|nr:S1 RNA-binding domain-containing protein [Erysipelotrichia bacterium]